MATETPSNYRERVGGYVKHNAEKGSDAIRDLVQQGHEQLVNSIAGLTVEQATFKPGEDEWSVLETMTHILEVKVGVVEICQALARGEAPEPASAELNEKRMRDGFSFPVFTTPDEANKAAVKANQALTGFLSGLADSANVEKTYLHPFVGPLNCIEWAVFQRLHDGNHGEQIEKIKASEGYPSA
jgi:hypothetical protein